MAQAMVMTGWLVLTPKGHRLTGSAFARLVAVALGKSLTPFPEPRVQARLIRHGAYRLVRHPFYAGLMVLSLGWACLWASRRGAALALLQAMLLDAKARREERWLREKFPDTDRYAAGVKRLIPGFSDRFSDFHRETSEARTARKGALSGR